ncbi:MAG: hypothetical protein WD872_09540 [Pirellulaceae bacterium]
MDEAKETRTAARERRPFQFGLSRLFLATIGACAIGTGIRWLGSESIAAFGTILFVWLVVVFLVLDSIDVVGIGFAMILIAALFWLATMQ